MITYKLKETEIGKMLFLCDANLIGKELIDEEKKIFMKIDEKFYEKKGNRRVIESLIKEASFINAIGEESVDVVGKFIKIKNVLYIKNVPHVQIYEL
jgi:hypothetical protein